MPRSILRLPHRAAFEIAATLRLLRLRVWKPAAAATRQSDTMRDSPECSCSQQHNKDFGTNILLSGFHQKRTISDPTGPGLRPGKMLFSDKDLLVSPPNMQYPDRKTPLFGPSNMLKSDKPWGELHGACSTAVTIAVSALFRAGRPAVTG